MSSNAHRLPARHKHAGVTIALTARRSAQAFLFATLFSVAAVPVAQVFLPLTIGQATALVAVFMMSMYVCFRAMFAFVSAVDGEATPVDDRVVARTKLFKVASFFLAVFIALAVIQAAAVMSLAMYWFVGFAWAMTPAFAVIKTLAYVMVGALITACALIAWSRHDTHTKIGREFQLAVSMLDGLHARCVHEHQHRPAA